MKYRYGVDSSTLHVRCSNRAAQKLYLHNLGYRIVETVQKYYQDGADAYYMELSFREQQHEAAQQQAAATAAGGPSTVLREKDVVPLLTEDSDGYFQHQQLSNQPSRSVA